LLLLISMPVSASAATLKDVSKAATERAALQKRLDRAAAAYDAAQAKLARTQAAIQQNEKGLEDARAKARLVRARLAARANVVYRAGPVGMLQFLMTSESLGDFGRRVKMIQEAADKDGAILAEATAVQRRTQTLREELDEKKRQESRLLSTMRNEAIALTTNFRKASELERRLALDRDSQVRREAAARTAAEADARRAAQDAARRAEAARTAEARRSDEAGAGGLPIPRPTTQPAPLRAAPAPAQVRNNPEEEQGAVTAVTARSLRCPVDGPTSFTDTWGAPRSGGRSHQGVDMFAAQGTPVAAISDGVVLRRETSAAGGLGLRIRGNDSTVYYYAHLSGYTNFVAGQRVTAGAHVGYVGATGNAAGGPPHLHFEVHPNGGSAINPTPTARRACGK
ncbi:MAG: M23 family metallopeptidase, partial [Actinomycetota bacterium]|nr:M23 family metallopeptidase [Actinomycetota bacterium]